MQRLTIEQVYQAEDFDPNQKSRVDVRRDGEVNCSVGDTPLRLKPRGFSLVLFLPASYAGQIALTRGRCHHLRLLGKSNCPQILLVR